LLKKHPKDIDMARRDYQTIRAQLLAPGIQARLQAGGLDLEAEIRKLDALYAELSRADSMMLTPGERLPHSLAVLAGNMREFYRVTKKLLAEMEQTNPLHPQLKEIRDFLEALSSHMPKDELR
jgi:hypothetical protein